MNILIKKKPSELITPETINFTELVRNSNTTLSLSNEYQSKMITLLNTEFTENYLAKTIELGRSWVQPNFQPNINPRKGLFALDNIWDGLGAIVKLNPEINYLFGKVTMYPNYNIECRDLLLYFLDYYFPDREELMRPFHPLLHNENKIDYSVFLQNLDFKEGIKVLNSYF